MNNDRQYLSDTLITWSKMTDKGFFVKTDVERDLMLCRYLEQFPIEKSRKMNQGSRHF